MTPTRRQEDPANSAWGQRQDARHAENLERFADIARQIKLAFERLAHIDVYMERDLREHGEIRKGIEGLKTDTETIVEATKSLKFLGGALKWALAVGASAATIAGVVLAVYWKMHGVG